MVQLQHHPCKTGLLAALALLCLVLLFVDGPGFSQRSHEYLWNLGHVFCFAVWGALLGVWRHDWSYARLFLAVMTLALGGGLFIELAQTVLGRYFSSADIFNNLLGGLLALAWFFSARWPWSLRYLRLLQVGLTLLLAVSCYPLGQVLLDEHAARQAMPILADFESPRELERWGGGAAMSLSSEVVSHGRYSLKAVLTTDRYSGVGLKFFPRDWRGFNRLAVDLYNPSDTPLRVTCRIHDRLHNNDYSDRYNRSHTLLPGWTTIDLDLEQVARAPQQRRLDLSQVAGLGLFVTEQQEAKTLYLDFLRLTR